MHENLLTVSKSKVVVFSQVYMNLRIFLPALYYHKLEKKSLDDNIFEHDSVSIRNQNYRYLLFVF